MNCNHSNKKRVSIVFRIGGTGISDLRVFKGGTAAEVAAKAYAEKIKAEPCATPNEVFVTGTFMTDAETGKPII